ncbi:MAG TPA: TadE/TadG family type IV pilus assembly protein [Candidatus Binataceae bacterium]|nr:TadE/TadG family type IV pilus assembly protein [Candidatus Binataceae bacterium]
MTTAARGIQKWRSQAGQAAAEFALVISVFLLATFAVTQLASAVLAYNTICSAARVAVRYAIVHGEGTGSASTIAAQESAVQQAAINAAPQLSLTTSNVAVSFPADTAVPSQLDAKVVITYNYKINVPSFSASHIITFSPITFPLTATSQMPVSQ